MLERIFYCLKCRINFEGICPVVSCHKCGNGDNVVAYSHPLALIDRKKGDLK